MWLEAELASSSKEMHDCMGMVEPEPKFVDRHGLYVAHSLSMNRNGFITVQVLNPTFAPIVVHKSEKLGIFQPVQSGSQVHSIETKINRATQQEPPSSNVLETIAKMKCSVEDLTQSEQQKFGEHNLHGGWRHRKNQQNQISDQHTRCYPHQAACKKASTTPA